MKILKRIFITLLLLILTFALTAVVIVFAYQNEVKDYMIQQLNKQLKTQVLVDSKNVQLTLFKSFPYASLDFKNVKMIGSNIQIPNQNGERKKILPNGKISGWTSDTLFSVEKISLQFNILDILRKNYVVKKIKIENGNVKLMVGTDGSVNWNVWKASADSTSSEKKSAFNMEKFMLDNINFEYLDYRNKNDISGSIHNGTTSGEFTSKKYDLLIKSDLLLHHLKTDNTNYVSEKPIKVDFNLSVDNDKEEYDFNDAQLDVADLKITVKGKYISGTSDYIDIYLKGKNMDIQSVLSLLPEKYSKRIRDYDSDGEFYCNTHIIGKSDSPKVQADFGINKAKITQQSSGIILKDVHLLGNYYFSPEKDFLEIKTFSTSLENGSIAGNFRIDNFSSPFLEASIKANLPLKDLKNLLKVDTIWNYPIESLYGNMKINLDYKGKINISGKYKKSDFEKMNLIGDMTLENSGIKIKNSTLAFDSINGSFVFDNNDITLNFFSGKTSRSNFYLKGSLNNILAYSFSDADIYVNANLQSTKLDLDEFLLNQQESSKHDTIYKIKFSPRVNFIFNSTIEELKFRKFEAKNIKGTFELKNQKMIADPISFSTMDGTVTASGMIDNTIDSSLLITCNADFKNVNINKLFSEFEDFGQNTITQKNLKGILTADVQFASVWKSDLTIDQSKVYMRSNMTVDKGELLNYDPMKVLSKYISMSELEDIKFSTLQNQIEIKDKKVFIPKMDIKSSALNVTLSGSHTFNNEIDYHFKVLLSDLLSKKARKAKKENNEFGVVEDDKEGKMSLFISMTGTVDNPIIKYDKQGAKQNRKENIANEKQTLKQILRDEFGIFKKDSTLNKKEKKKDDGKFIIKWDEDKKNDKEKKEDDDF